MYLPYFASLLIFGISLVLLILIVPKEFIINKLIFGIVFGILQAILLIYYMEIRFGFWDFIREDILYLGELPIFLSATWTPLVIMFIYLLKLSTHLLSRIIVLILFPLLSTLSHYAFELNNMLTYQNWSYLETFLLSLLIHMAIIGGLYLVGELQDKKKTIF
ncbi:hypothetical protein [Natranaerobius thermophilus]|uniref:Uncharacterized protein n=1 Tax=Natranaerobius thermophilus (strain ATCC BAA-1301 / DSM 18059 / JW/NM-WN-LF) TaxID=457570 RepID=B2A547_NATTJ|nr:hypothetical protein [Natranaerobius thermophilus]ACB85289.1 hypothetical protein Nther_1715 [Natranaerobius thermophilus JW/NM-WN-LF]